jgi:hypothetical protein
VGFCINFQLDCVAILFWYILSLLYFLECSVIRIFHLLLSKCSLKFKSDIVFVTLDYRSVLLNLLMINGVVCGSNVNVTYVIIC